MYKFILFLKICCSKANKTSLKLFKIIIPVAILVRILQALDIIHYFAKPLEPLMNLVGLPGSMGLVWATAMLSNIYSAIVVFYSLLPNLHLTVANSSVLAGMILVAHNLLVEGAISRKTGVRFLLYISYRIICGFLFGLILHLLYTHFNLLQNNLKLPMQAISDPSWGNWILEELRQFIFIYLVIFTLYLLMDGLQALNLLNYLLRLLNPLLRILGIGTKAGTLTMAGMLLGIAYGGGMMIEEAHSGRVQGKDIFLSIYFLGLCHAVIEDTFLMILMLGADVSAVLIGRVIFALVIVSCLSLIIKKIPATMFSNYLCTPVNNCTHCKTDRDNI